ncbi:MAG: hypothetical protein LBI43_04195 [Streptococcaceae bacterium]|jgi:hypothetical protein|nr:hypothetical protein [Streptococcaceae bacterium]
MLNDLLNQFFKFTALFIFLGIILHIIWTILWFLVISRLTDDELEHPILTFLIIFFAPFGFAIELARNTSITNNKRRIKAAASDSQKLVLAILAEDKGVLLHNILKNGGQKSETPASAAYSTSNSSSSFASASEAMDKASESLSES